MDPLLFNNQVPIFSLAKRTEIKLGKELDMSKNKKQYGETLPATGSFTLDNLINYSSLIGYNGLIYSNLDCVFNITQSRVTYFSPTDLTDFKFINIGGQSTIGQFLQYRRPNSQGWGLNLISQNYLQLDRYTLLSGGNYLENKQSLMLALATATDGVNLVTAENCLDGSEDNNLKILISDLALCLLVLAPTGNLVCKSSQTRGKISAIVLYLLSFAFENIILFKPATLDNKSDLQYIIGINRKLEISKVVDIFNSMAMGNYYNLKLSKKFTDWLTEANNQIQGSKQSNINLPDIHGFIYKFRIPMIGDKI